MRKDNQFCLGQMLDSAEKALRLAKGKDREDYDEDEVLRIALTHLIQIMGEAARLVSPSFQEAHPEIPWKAIMGMRHKIVHDYFSVDEEIVWETVTEELPPLVDQLKRLVRQ
jgi:uncharacterized protein with HEPN domain